MLSFRYFVEAQMPDWGESDSDWFVGMDWILDNGDEHVIEYAKKFLNHYFKQIYTTLSDFSAQKNWQRQASHNQCSRPSNLSNMLKEFETMNQNESYDIVYNRFFECYFSFWETSIQLLSQETNHIDFLISFAEHFLQQINRILAFLYRMQFKKNEISTDLLKEIIAVLEQLASGDYERTVENLSKTFKEFMTKTLEKLHSLLPKTQQGKDKLNKYKETNRHRDSVYSLIAAITPRNVGSEISHLRNKSQLFSIYFQSVKKHLSATFRKYAERYIKNFYHQIVI